MDTNTRELLNSIRGTFIDTIKYYEQRNDKEFNSSAFTAGVASDYLVSVLSPTRDDFEETLSEFIGTIIRVALEARENLENITEGLAMSILYVSKSLEYEPLQLISDFAAYSMEHALKLEANAREVAKGLMKGVVVVAKKANLEVELALAMAAASMMKSAYSILGPKAQVIFARDREWLNYFLSNKTETDAEFAPLTV